MTGDQWIVVATIVGTVVAVSGLLWTVKRAATEDARSKAREQAEALGKSFSDGARSRDGEIALLRSQRDDARLERDQARADAERWETRYLDVRDRRGGGGR